MFLVYVIAFVILALAVGAGLVALFKNKAGATDDQKSPGDHTNKPSLGSPSQTSFLSKPRRAVFAASVAL
ncbi:MAG: hypothetical protein LBC35_02440, partial [Coriobacteriales bacterium]|nr:hypothetical protein [Coriobacteriales bacterium]MDR2672154.1 hypothetical protein [Coriobacteriales bacterium]